jgi:hypothetical protein
MRRLHVVSCDKPLEEPLEPLEEPPILVGSWTFEFLVLQVEFLVLQKYCKKAALCMLMGRVKHTRKLSERLSNSLW